ncbi:hypothetical protein [Sphingomonas mucosissima]|uniref:Uncharacterized protein n=1 Tax=Sphingomonas mucosissima TaxID=370959 RepID=A0A245ZIK9_9SPHN|nr:hypothetical protein [Sphingomonas mucosissima]OWK29580.1 hypothetical protein SPMU_20000 [Sphingomonas mucosissima]
MVDRSWGGPPLSNVPVRTNDSLEERAARRAQAREDRANARGGDMAERLEARAKAREAQAAERERIRQERLEAEAKLAQSDPHTAAAQRKRGSGRKDIVREQRDTTGYAMVVNADRIRKLAARGASIASLSAVLGLSTQEIEEALAATP